MPLMRPHRVSSSPASKNWNDTGLIALPDESPEEDDAEDLLLDAQNLVQERKYRSIQVGGLCGDVMIPRCDVVVML